MAGGDPLGAEVVVVAVPHGLAGEQPRGQEPPQRLAGLFKDLLITAEASANIVLLRTPAGAAQFLASALDQTAIPEAMGTIAGDDTIFVLAREPVTGERLAELLAQLAQ